MASIGGKEVIKSLSYAAEKCAAGDVRLSALVNLEAGQSWEDVAEVVQKVANSDPDSAVREEAQAMLAKHAPGG